MDRHEMVFDGGHLALDFLNTGPLPAAGRDDLLASPATVLAWLEGAGLAGEEELGPLRASPPDVRVLLSDARRLRDAVAGIVGARTAGVQVPELALMEVNRVLSARAGGVRLAAEAGVYRIVATETWERPLGLLAPVARAAAHLLIEADPARLRRCHATGCELWFLDTSRNGRRRWCSMSRCGNRAKVAAHYRRHHDHA